MEKNNAKYIGTDSQKVIFKNTDCVQKSKYLIQLKEKWMPSVHLKYSCVDDRKSIVAVYNNTLTISKALLEHF